MKYHLAIDIGASSGRHILGHVEKGCMMLEEIYRFDNIQVRKNGHDCWNTEQLWQSILEGLRACTVRPHRYPEAGVQYRVSADGFAA